MTEVRYYRGFDYANIREHRGICVVSDDGTTLRAHFGNAIPNDAPISKEAVDCPFGTTRGFEAGLRGECCDDSYGDGYKTRATEQWLRQHVRGFAINSDWRRRTKDQKKRFPRASFYNSASHVQPSLGLVIVPEFLHWLANEVSTSKSAEHRLKRLAEARCGEGPIVEAHPRVFMYSALERIRRSEPVPLKVLDAASGYKDRKPAKATGKANRQYVFDFLADHIANWTGESSRLSLAIEGGVDTLVDVDHAFDAWLSALTAWADACGEVRDWKSIENLTRDVIEVEGHIHILKVDY